MKHCTCAEGDDNAPDHAPDCARLASEIIDDASYIVGWSVHTGTVDTGAFYNAAEYDKAVDAAKRWNAKMTALVAHPAAPVSL